MIDRYKSATDISELLISVADKSPLVLSWTLAITPCEVDFHLQ